MKQKRITWTVDPTPRDISLMEKYMNRLRGKNGERRGLRTKIVLEAFRLHARHLRGKRDGVI